MAKEDTLEFPGVVKELLPNAHIRQEKCARTGSAFWRATRFRWK
jgi:hypothetical protein